MKNRKENIQEMEVRSRKTEDRRQYSPMLCNELVYAIILTKNSLSRCVRKERAVTSELRSDLFLFTLGMIKMLAAQSSQPKVYSLLTINYYNSPSRRVRSTRKISHLSELKFVRAREQMTFPENLNFFPFRAIAQRVEGTGIFANNLKPEYAYET